eukprot:scaffold65967_cov98-Cyclotella_meneghiniana.AAC.2
MSSPGSADEISSQRIDLHKRLAEAASVDTIAVWLCSPLTEVAIQFDRRNGQGLDRGLLFFVLTLTGFACFHFCNPSHVRFCLNLNSGERLWFDMEWLDL